VQGTVVLEVDVYCDGSVGNIKVLRSVISGAGGLDEAASDAVRKIKFIPGKSAGKPVDTHVIIPVEFRLGTPEK
jgi:protein TonB